MRGYVIPTQPLRALVASNARFRWYRACNASGRRSRMNPKAPIPLLPVALAASALSLIAVILVVFGFPMAGAESALICLGVSALLTFGMAYAFGHNPKGGH
jgi:hypothetical protein